MQQKTKIIIVVVGFLTAFAFGRYTSPEKVITEIKTVEVEKKTDDVKKDTDKHKTTVTNTVKKPDGTEETTTTTTEDSTTAVQKHGTDNTSLTSDNKKEVDGSVSKVTISALAGIPFSSGPVLPVYGVAVTRPVLGPITVGAWFLTPGVVGGSLGLTF